MSSYSENGGQCVEVATNLATPHGIVPVRDSKNVSGPTLTIPATAFTAFVAACPGRRPRHRLNHPSQQSRGPTVRPRWGLGVHGTSQVYPTTRISALFGRRTLPLRSSVIFDRNRH